MGLRNHGFDPGNDIIGPSSSIFVSASHAARCVARHGVGSHADAVALVIRADMNGTALWFFDLQANEVQHLRALVDRLRPSP